ncbi:PREDICTED: early nodulin-like protein 1 [Fragaria vesca subsp. vesca]|uniref:early nodulin-like protein 1 n=1 Tax=Fragaria vesca subsp. vesca TaxID=101020 RepID=UPI0002C300BD|nr:PREDICTED: early nodulin-like protein 1 [Fragaria vesca subsp. vesca]
MVKIMNALVAVIALAAMLHRTEAEDYTVGDDLGWTIPPDGADTYAEWAAEHTPLVVDEDTITFDFPVGEQDVAFVTKQDFDSCTTTNPLWQSSEPARVTLVQEGTFYFIGTLAGHCAKGQKC